MNLPYKFKLALFNLSSCKRGGVLSYDKDYVLVSNEHSKFKKQAYSPFLDFRV